MIGLKGKQVVLRDGELLRRERDNRSYMLRLTRENLMRNYRFYFEEYLLIFFLVFY